VQRPSGLIKVEGSASTFRVSHLDSGKECFVKLNIDNRSRWLSDTYFDAATMTVKGSFMIMKPDPDRGSRP
jgi:hypothetical protein